MEYVSMSKIDTVLLISNNIMFLPRIKNAVEPNVDVTRTTQLSELKDSLINSNVTCVIVDLEYNQEIWEEAIKYVRQTVDVSPRIVAYGPHEDESSMNLAKSLGCDAVTPKGVFNSRMKNIINPE